MSKLLKEAIVDAQALKEAALKNAEAAIIDKYSAEVKKTIEQLLEQDAAEDALPADLGLGADTEEEPSIDLGADAEASAGSPLDDLGDTGAAAPEVTEVTEDEIPLAAVDGLSQDEGTGLSDMPKEGDTVEFNVDLGTLQEAVAALEKELELDEDAGNAPGAPADAGSFAGEEADEEEDENDSAAALAGSAAATNSIDAAQRGAFQEGDTVDMDALTDAIMEKLGLGEEEIEEAKIAKKGKHDDGDGKDEKCDHVPCGDQDKDEPKVKEENIDALVDAIMEKLTVDMGAELSGWAGRSADSIKWQMEKAFAHRRGTEAAEEMEDLKKAQEELVFENKQTNEELSQYKQAIETLRENLQDVNLSNARLLYTNRVLRNTSLNERQKTKIAEAISNAGSVTEAKTIFETLQSTVESAPKRGPQSLSEAIGRNRTSVIRASREESTPSDPLQERMKRLAGIE